MIEIQVSTDDSVLTLKCDRAVWDGDGLYQKLAMASFAGSSSSVKAMNALIQSGKARGLVLDSKRLFMNEDGYTITKAKMGRFDAVHAVAVANVPGMFFGDLMEGVRNFILSDAIDTPVLDAWVPVIVAELQDRRLIREPNCYGISAFICKFDSKVVDEIVASGLKMGILKI